MRTRHRILVVDDEEIFRKNLVRMLRLADYEAEIAGNGEEALELLVPDDFDVVLLDLKMPGMSGEEILREMRARACTAEVVVLTGHASLDSAVTLIQEGAYEYQLKPYAQDDLLAVIKMACENRRLKKEKPAKQGKGRGRLLKLFS